MNAWRLAPAWVLLSCGAARAQWSMPASVTLPGPETEFALQLQSVRGSASALVPASFAREDDPALRAVLERLRGSVPEEFVRAAFADPRVRIEQAIVDRFERPAEQLPWERYRAIFITPERIQAGAAFYRDNRALVEAVAADYGVDPLVFTSIVGVETFYGRHRGAWPVFNALYTAIRAVPRRSSWATGELAAWLRLAWGQRADPHREAGSYAGAFGFGQFIPSSWNAYSVDRDGDGLREPYEWPDALASVSNYLVRNGYRPGETDFSRQGTVWKAVYAYNHSDHYVRVVLELREELKKALAV